MTLGFKNQLKMISSHLVTCKYSAGLKGITFPFFLIGSVDQNADLLAVLKLHAHLHSHTHMKAQCHYCFLAGAQVLAGAGEPTELLGKMGRSSWLLLFASWFASNKCPQIDLGKVRRPWFYFIALTLGVL